MTGVACGRIVASSRGMTSIEGSGDAVTVAAGVAGIVSAVFAAGAPAVFVSGVAAIVPAVLTPGVGITANELTYNIEETHNASMHDTIAGNDLNFLPEPNLIT